MENLNDIEIQEMSVILAEEIEIPGQSSPGSSLALTSTMPEIRGIELLKDASGTVDVGKTIREMFLCIKNMEKQLSDVLAINASLNQDIKASRELITNLRMEKQDLQNAIDALNSEIPFKRELQAEIEHLIEERNNTQTYVRQMKTSTEQARQESLNHKTRISELQEEKADLLKDISYLEAKVNAALRKINAYAKEINILKGERHIHQERIAKLEKGYRDCVEERDILISKTIDL